MPSLRPRANPVKPRPKMNEAISDAQGTRDKQIQQHLLHEPQHAEKGKNKIMYDNRHIKGVLFGRALTVTICN